MDAPDKAYVFKLLEELRWSLVGLHQRISELERLRYGEAAVRLGPEASRTGVQIRTGLTADLVEQVKAALTTHSPVAIAKPLRRGDTGKSNADKREAFWNAWLRKVNRQLVQLVDAQVGMGLGMLKAVYYPWPKEPRKRLQGETAKRYNERLSALKRQWGVPFRLLPIHPLTCYFELGVEDEITEIIEESWKPKRAVYSRYEISEAGLDVRALAAVGGTPSEGERPLPVGRSNTTMVKVVEYWTEECRQVYVDGQLVDQEESPGVIYIPLLGRLNSSRDLDKLGLSVAENLRFIEPYVDRFITMMHEAADLIVHKRLALELPEGATMPEADPLLGDDGAGEGDDNRPKVKIATLRLVARAMRPLPPGAVVKDPYAGADAVFGVMPLVELLLRLAGQHGVASIFKGTPPAAAGSGYRDNSLYLMARSMFEYLVQNYSISLARLISWLETQVVQRVRETVFIDERELSIKDIEEYPVEWTVAPKPMLPQNLIAEGQFYMLAHDKGHVPQRVVLEKGFNQEQPGEWIRERILEDIEKMLLPVLYKDVLEQVGILPKEEPAPEMAGPNGEPLAPGGPSQNPMAPPPPPAPGGAQQLLAGQARAGQMRQPPYEPGEFPPGMGGM